MNDSERLLADVVAGRVQVVTVEPDGTVSEGVAAGVTVLSGAFDPLHVGHEGMLKAAATIPVGRATSSTPPMATAEPISRPSAVTG